jgi:hypothetical protein
MLREQQDGSDSDGPTTTGDGEDNDIEIDEFTLAYLEEQGAKMCPDCGVWIVREDGCNNVMCRCGCRFCFCCGRKGTCTGGTFYNNVEQSEEGRSFNWDPDCESVAGVWPLFVDYIDNEEYWYDNWFPLDILEEYEETQLYPLFETPVQEEYESREIDPLFEGRWLDELDPNRHFPISQGDWYIE